MPTTNGNRKLLDLKRWEFCTPAPVATASGAFVVSSRHYRQQQLYVQSNAVAYLYNPFEDGWVQVPNPTLLNAIAPGACGVAGSFSTGTSTGFFLTATAGTTTSITTNQTLARDLRGYSVHIMGGPNAGKTKVIASNTQQSGASVITFEGAPETAAFEATNTLYRLITPVFYCLTAGTLGSGIFRKYDFATNQWITLAQINLPPTIGTEGRLVATPSWIDTDYKPFVIGQATAGGALTLTHTGKNWATNQWKDAYQLRITAGPGAGQVRPIASNTATQITVTAGGNWTTNPTDQSQYVIEGNDDYLYFVGANTSVYRYSIGSGSWTNLSPSPARAVAAGVGASAHWVWDAEEAEWNVENTIINGRRIYSFRGTAGAVLEYYDIPSNAWTNGVTYAPATEVFGAGTKYIYKGSYLYIQKDATGRWFRHNFATSEMDGWGTMTYTQGAAIAGDTAFDVTYRDGATEITYAYMLLNTSTVLLRQMVI